jgi:hypothetical protein
LSFELDTSIEHGVRLTQLIDSVNKPEQRPAAASGEAHGESAAGHEPDHEFDEGPDDGPDDGHVVDEGDYIDPKSGG